MLIKSNKKSGKPDEAYRLVWLFISRWPPDAPAQRLIGNLNDTHP
jgi:hypothetical protein